MRLYWCVPLAFVLGLWLQLQQSVLWSALAYAGLLTASGVIALALRKSRNVYLCIAGSAFAGAIAFGLTGLRAVWFASHALLPQLEGVDLDVQGVVADLVQPNEQGVRFVFEVESASRDHQAVQVPQTIQLGWYEESGHLNRNQLKPGSRWHLQVRLKRPHGNQNPFGFDYELWLWERDIQATGYVRAVLSYEGQTHQAWLAGWRNQVRDAVFQVVPQASAAGVIAALSIGDQAAIDKSDWDTFRRVGIAHLVSISGLHITMFAWLAAVCIGWLWRCFPRLCLWWPTPYVAGISGCIWAFFYSALSGWGVPAQRTVVMLILVTMLRLLGCVWPWFVVWAWTMVCVLLWDPWALLQSGFWLSFVAVGVLFATNNQEVTKSQGLDLKAKFLAQLHEQKVVLLALTPLTLLLFQQISVVGLIANFFAIPIVTLVITPLSFLGVVWHGFWQWAAVSVMWLMHVLEWLAHWPWAVISTPAPALWAGIFATFGGILLAMPWPWGMRLLGLPFCIPVLCWQADKPHVGQFELLAADIGQGNAVIVRTANHTMLYDTGPRYSENSDAGERVLLPLLHALGATPNLVMLSHSDTDHIGGADSVLKNYPNTQLIASLQPNHFLAQRYPMHLCHAGIAWVWDDVKFEVLHPLLGAPFAMHANANSCVLRISHGQTSALLVGDIEAEQETTLLAQYPAAILKADALLVPHHGSKTSSTEGFISTVAPKVALVQAGYRNIYHHPAAIVKERYLQHGIRFIESPSCGAQTWISSQPGEVTCERKIHQRYWQPSA